MGVRGEDWFLPSTTINIRGFLDLESLLPKIFEDEGVGFSILGAELADNIQKSPLRRGPDPCTL
jgi:hypothetical protein